MYQKYNVNALLKKVNLDDLEELSKEDLISLVIEMHHTIDALGHRLKCKGDLWKDEFDKETGNDKLRQVFESVDDFLKNKSPSEIRQHCQKVLTELMFVKMGAEE